MILDLTETLVLQTMNLLRALLLLRKLQAHEQLQTTCSEIYMYLNMDRKILLRQQNTRQKQVQLFIFPFM